MPIGTSKNNYLESVEPAGGNPSSRNVTEAKYGIQYNPQTQARLDVSQAAHSDFTNPKSQALNEYSQDLQENEKFRRQANELFMEGIRRQRELEKAAIAKRDRDATVGLLNGDIQPGNNQGPSDQNWQDAPSGNFGGINDSTPHWETPEPTEADQTGLADTGHNRGPTPFRRSVISLAKEYLGVPYVWGGGHYPNATTPSMGGLDCSGLTGIVYRQLGIELPAVSDAQTAYGVEPILLMLFLVIWLAGITADTLAFTSVAGKFSMHLTRVKL